MADFLTEPRRSSRGWVIFTILVVAVLLFIALTGLSTEPGDIGATGEVVAPTGDATLPAPAVDPQPAAPAPIPAD